MKHFILILLLWLSSTIVWAQTDQGNIFISGSSDMGLIFGGSKDRIDDVDHNARSFSNFNLNLKAGYFMIDNLNAGLFLSTTSTKETREANNVELTDKSMRFAIGPFIRYYYPIDDIQPFFEMDLLVGTQKDEQENIQDVDENTYGLLQLDGGLGISVFLNKHISFDPMVKYTYFHLDDKNDDYRYILNQFGFFAGFSVYL